MNFESQLGGENPAETPESRFDKYYQESLEIAQGLSRRWKILRERTKENPSFLAGHPLLEEIDALARPPVSGIQSWFESQVKSVNVQSDPDARSRMIYRVKEELERIRQKVDDLLGPSGDQTRNLEKKTILKRSDINEVRSRDFSESCQLLLAENGFQFGDKIVFFADGKEREGVIEGDRQGVLNIRDVRGLPWGIMGIMADSSGYIRKP